MLNRDQQQVVEGGSIAQQAGRDIVNVQQGVSVAEVTVLFDFLWKNNFPVVIEEARRIAQENARAFAAEFSRQLEGRQHLIDVKKFADPDVQATISDAVKASARRGEAANPVVLASLVAERLSADADNYMEIVFSESVLVVPRLTPAQISLLSLVIFVSNMKFVEGLRWEDIERVSEVVLPLFEPAFGMPSSQKRHILYAGAAMVLSKNDVHMGVNLYQTKAADYNHLCNGVPFSVAVHQHAPSYAKILDQYIKDKLQMVTLNSVGQAIALANLSRCIYKLDYGSWLNLDDV